MDERLKNLRNALNRNHFKELKYNGKLKEATFQRINQKETNEKDLFIVILNLLSKEKTGFEISRGIRSKGIEDFEKKEGYLYTLLHKMEQQDYITSHWKSSDQKFYFITKQGKKALRRLRTDQSNLQSVFKEIFEG